jgi:hypothetical protein
MPKNCLFSALCSIKLDLTKMFVTFQNFQRKIDKDALPV